LSSVDELIERELAHAESVTVDLRGRLARSQEVATALVAATTGIAGVGSVAGGGVPAVAQVMVSIALVLLVLAAVTARGGDGPVSVTRPAGSAMEAWLPAAEDDVEARRFALEVKLDLREAVLGVNDRLARRLSSVLRLEAAAAAALALGGTSLLVL
jgi:hypothetical protein